MPKKKKTEIIPWKEVEKQRLTTNISEEAFERIRFQNYLTRKSVGEILTDLIYEHLEEIPEDVKEELEKAKKDLDSVFNRNGQQ